MMTRKQRKYDMEYKIQAVKLSEEIGPSKAAAELGISVDTLAREGRLDTGSGTHNPGSAMSLTQEITLLRKQVKEQEKEIRRLKEENAFLEEASAFFAARVGSQQKPKNDVYC